MLGIEYAFDCIDISPRQNFKKAASNKEINRVNKKNKKTSVTYKNYRKQLEIIIDLKLLTSIFQGNLS